MRKKASYQLDMIFTNHLIDHLSTGQYMTDIEALVEGITNGLNACIRKGVLPRVEIFRHAKQIIIRDLGDGMDQERQKRFLRVGISPELGDERQEAQFGVGKLAPFTFADEYTVRTSFDNTSLVYVFTLNLEQIKRQNPAVPPKIDVVIEAARNPEYDAPTGSFTTVVITKLHPRAPSEREIIERLPNHLPILDPWEVTVNGVSVPHRSFEGELIEATYLAEPGTVDVKLAIAAKSTQVDEVYLAGGGGRRICALTQVPGARRIFPDDLFDIKVSGYINVREWRKKVQSVSRGSLKASVASGTELPSIAEGFSVHVLPKLRARLGTLEEEAGSELLYAILEEVIEELEIFDDGHRPRLGSDKLPGKDRDQKDDDGDASEDEEEEVLPNSGGKGSPTKERKKKKRRAFYFKGQRFEIFPSDRLPGDQPCLLRRTDNPPIIFLDTHFPTYKRTHKASKMAFRDYIRRTLIEAATLYFGPDNLSEHFYRSLSENLRKVEERLPRKR